METDTKGVHQICVNWTDDEPVSVEIQFPDKVRTFISPNRDWPRFIPVSERLPECTHNSHGRCSDFVLAFDRTCGWHRGYYDYDDAKWFLSGYVAYEEYDGLGTVRPMIIDAWLPMPPMPE